MTEMPGIPINDESGQQVQPGHSEVPALGRSITVVTLPSDPKSVFQRRMSGQFEMTTGSLTFPLIKPLSSLVSAARTRTRTRASLTALPGSPITENPGMPGGEAHCTSTSRATTPSKATV